MDAVRQATIYEVASHAGVSIATVSYVMNGKKKVSEDTAARVKEAAEKLGYHPNQSARSLRSSKSGLIGMIIPTYDNAFFGAYAEFIARMLKKRGFSLFVACSLEDEDMEQRLLDMMQSLQVEALLIDPVRIGFDYNRLLANYSFPVVYYDRKPESENFNGVFCNVRGAIRQVVEDMIDRGRKRIALLLPDTMHNAVQFRLEGFYDALDSKGIKRNPMLVLRGNATEKNGYDYADYAIKSLKADAILTANRTMAVGTIRYFNTHSIHPREDLSVAVMGVYDWSSVLVPQITTVIEPIEPMAAQTVDLLMKLVAKPDRTPEIITLDGYISELTSI